MGTRFGFVASEKGAETECDTGLGLRMQPNKSLSRNKMMPCHDHQNLPTAGNGFGLQGCCNGDGDCGPSFLNSTNQLSSSITHNLYDVVGAGDVLPKTLLHHPDSDIFSFNSSETKSKGVNVVVTWLVTIGGMVNVRVPFFTEAQRQELERQTMIYKNMMASVPVPVPVTVSVPPQLFRPPITNTPSSFARMHHSNQVKGSLELGIDPEPWRCRRTDGKKWRCSRDVVPDQKYCERHSHKSRPRSRKPVETHFINIGNNQDSSTIPYTHTKPPFVNHQSPPFSTSMASAPTLHDQTRCLEWFMKGETVGVVDGSNQDWLKAGLRMDNATDCNATMDISKHHQYEQTHQGLNDQCSLLLAPKLRTPFQETLNSSRQAQETRHFIDAWSATEREQIGEIGSNTCSVFSNYKFPMSSLSLSMSGGNGRCDEENENAQMGTIGDMKCQWMNPVSWLGSPPGGPLAEALCLGVAASPGCNSGGTTSSRSSS